MKEKNSIFNTFIKSIYDVKSFSISARLGIKRAVVYMLLLTIIFGGIKSIFIARDYYNQVSKISSVLKQNDYNIHIEDDKLKIEKSPIIFNDDKLVIYIDDNKTTLDQFQNYSDLQNADNNIFILQDGVVFKSLENEHMLIYKTLFNGKAIDNNKIQLLINQMKIIFIITIFLVNIFSLLIDLLIDYLIIVTIASLISLFMRMIVKHSALWSLVIYASTLPLIILTILQIVRPDVNFEATFIVGTLTYLIIIFKDIKYEIIKRFNKK